MNLDELTQKAGNVLIAGGDIRSAILAVLESVKATCVPGDGPERTEYDAGWSDCRAETLHRLDALIGEKGETR